MDGATDCLVVAVGSQCWFAENLRTTVFQDSTEIPLAQGSTFDLTSPARTQYNNSSAFVDDQGYLYNGGSR